MTWEAPVDGGADEEWEYPGPEGPVEVASEAPAESETGEPAPEVREPELEAEETAPEKPRRAAPEPEPPRQPDEWRRA
ncbi:MAG: hypothetical protein E6G66_14000, partial [Actinobacteria bacterium]